MVHVRMETEKDRATVREVIDKAFEQPQEGNVVDILSKEGAHDLSLVAEVEDKIVGHIFFSPVTVEGPEKTVTGTGLAPLAVLPEYQNRGIGSLLVRESLEIIREKDISFVAVLGYGDYYARFGFEKASKYGLRCQWEGVPDNAFRVIILDGEKMQNIRGVVKYSAEWDEAV